MTPSFSILDSGNCGFGHPENHRYFSLGSSTLRQSANFGYCDFGEFGHSVSFSLWRAFRMCSGSRAVSASDSVGLRFCAMTVSAGNSFRACFLHISALLHHIFNVFLLCSRKQMGRIHAFPIVATMTDLKAGISVGDKKGNPVRREYDSSNTEFAIHCIMANRGTPFPAFIRPSFFDLIPKSFLVLVRQFRDVFSSFHASIFRVIVSVCRWLNPAANARNLH